MTSPRAGKATVRYFGGAKAAAGTRLESVAVAEGTTVDDLVWLLASSHGDTLTRILTVSGLLLDEVAVRDRTVIVADGAVLDVLPPTAGG